MKYFICHSVSFICKTSLQYVTSMASAISIQYLSSIFFFFPFLPQQFHGNHHGYKFDTRRILGNIINDVHLKVHFSKTALRRLVGFVLGLYIEFFFFF